MQRQSIDWFLLHGLPRIRIPFAPYGVERSLRDAGRRLIRPGHLLFSWSPLGLSSLLTRGVDHAALCVEVDGPDINIAEMNRDGFNTLGFDTFCSHSRRVLICKCKDFTESYIQEVIRKCWTFQDVVYDTSHDPRNRRLNCAELDALSDFDGRIDYTTVKSIFFEYPLITPQCLLDAPNVEVVWDSAGKFLGMVKS